MKKTVLRYGLYASAFIVLFFAASWMIMGSSENPDYKTQEVLGYSGMVISMLFIFAGLKYYRDKVNGGELSFGQGMKLGLLIALIPSLIFGLFDVIYVSWIDPDFMDKYYTHMVSDMKASLPAAEYEVKLKELESQKGLFNNLGLQFFLMFITVFLIGLIVTVVSSLILKRKRVLQTA